MDIASTVSITHLEDAILKESPSPFRDHDVVLWSVSHLSVGDGFWDASCFYFPDVSLPEIFPPYLVYMDAS